MKIVGSILTLSKLMTLFLLFLIVVKLRRKPISVEDKKMKLSGRKIIEYRIRLEREIERDLKTIITICFYCINLFSFRMDC